MFNIEDYNYDLPEDLIAQVPKSRRDQSRLLFLERHKYIFSDHHFYDLPFLLKPGDLLVVNNTRVFPARIYGRKQSGGQIELLVLDYFAENASQSNTRWCLLKSSKRPKIGHRLFFEGKMSGLVEETNGNGLMRVVFDGPQPIDRYLDERGRIPLPPYIRRDKKNRRSPLDWERYQTVFAKESGAVAAPTAGLHFTDHLIRKLEQTGLFMVELTLHVGYGTFRPVRSRDIRNHQIGEEYYSINQKTADLINTVKQNNQRVIAVGTTVVRALETARDPEAGIVPGDGKTDLFITPGFEFKVVDGLITNFHLPRSSLLFLVSAFAGRPLIMKSYQWAVKKKYRFYSYGDAMLIL